ncbi:hypothetical protein CRI94_01280 [Longibacter salinarum]|uniref:Uncharacterized protein n=1 Tax=Longibacter salinarum TaxID=1850348 RepID=A0A2A8D2A8_9BACT|nr:hypothetical protein CRI94_01280 [Longibacter salinarum]
MAWSYKIINWAAILLSISRVGSFEAAMMIFSERKEGGKTDLDNSAQLAIFAAALAAPRLDPVHVHRYIGPKYSNMPVTHGKNQFNATCSLLLVNHARLVQVKDIATWVLSSSMSRSCFYYDCQFGVTTADA